MKTAIVHYWLVGMRGGERVLEEICKIYPDADIYTHVFDPAHITPLIKQHKIQTSFIAKLPFAVRHYQKYLGFMPRALEQLDLSGYDLILSSESGPTKGIVPAPGARHICYCHSPMRYIWDEFHTYTNHLDPVSRFAFSHIAHRMRIWDVVSAARVDAFVANSSFTASRIERYYRRPADIVFPPVDTSRFAPSANRGNYFLFASQLVPYKKADLAVEAFRNIDAPLYVVGDGSERKRLEKTAPANVTFLGRVSDNQLEKLYAECRALIFPGQEDFGIVPLEAMASGRPVIAFNKGGARDTVIPNETGLFFDEQSASALTAAVKRFYLIEDQFDQERLVAHAASFSQDRFRTEFKQAVDRVLNGDPVSPPAYNMMPPENRADTKTYQAGRNV